VGECSFSKSWGLQGRGPSLLSPSPIIHLFWQDNSYCVLRNKNVSRDAVCLLNGHINLIKGFLVLKQELHMYSLSSFKLWSGETQHPGALNSSSAWKLSLSPTFLQTWLTVPGSLRMVLILSAKYCSLSTTLDILLCMNVILLVLCIKCYYNWVVNLKSWHKWSQTNDILFKLTVLTQH